VDEASVRDQLYGRRGTVTAMPRSPGAPGALGGRYHVIERIGAGATAAVYRARDGRLRRDVAVKLLAERLADDPGSLRRFRREAELAGRLAHPNVAAIFDAGSRPRPYIVAELVRGRDVATLLDADRPISTTDALDLVVQVCEALGHAHGRGVLHGDVTPRNVVVEEQEGTAKLVDFGVAVDLLGRRKPTKPRGTPGYLAPELLRGGAPSVRSDLYSLGVLAYRLLGGPPPFPRPEQEETAPWPAAMTTPPSRPPLRSELPPALTAVVGLAMASRPDARPASVAEFRRELLAARGGTRRLRAAA
jgi:serine/threonine protein kinase